MQNLIQFFARFSALFLFLILEVVCFILIVRHNDVQRDIFLNSSNIFSAKANEWYDQMVKYNNLQVKADSLAKDNARLKTMLYNSENYQAVKRNVAEDSLFRQRYETVEASIINNSVTSRNNMMTIDRGAKDGIAPGMGVMGDKGLVGIVKNTSASYSTVLSLLHNATRISAAIKRNHYFGTLVWRGFNPQKMSLEAVPKHADIQVGDTLETSGYSHIFPQGVMLGMVDTFWIERGSNFYNIDVTLINDMSRADVVYIVRNLSKIEQDSLEKNLVQ